MKELVRHTIKRYEMLPDGARVVCGLSGGADSVSLLLCLRELGYDVCACHLNHGMRGAQADGDEAFCRMLCDTLDVPFLSESCDVFAEAEKRKLSPETAARELRYAFFTRCARTLHAPYIATAHTADDNLETMLFHLIRGTGAAGLAGIPPVRGNIVRPLIAAERRQVEAYLRAHGQSWRTDETNLDDGCTRNRLRHHVVPALKEIEPKAARHALEAAQTLRQENAYLEEETAARAETPLAALPPALRARRVRALMREAGVPMGEITRKHIRAVCALAEKGRGCVSLPGNMRASARADGLTIAPVPAPPPIHLTPEKPAPFGAYRVALVRKISDIHSSFKYYAVSYDTINVSRLTVRNWRSADRMHLPGARGERSLKRLYAERGIPPETRDGLPVLCCGDAIVAAAGLGTDSRFCGRDGYFVLYKKEKMEKE